MTLHGKSRLAWQCTLILYGCLVIALTLDHTVIRSVFYWPVWLMQTAPLLLILPGLVQRRARSGIWLCFIILFHLLSAIDNTATSGHPVFYSLMSADILFLFTTSLLFVRWQRLQDQI